MFAVKSVACSVLRVGCCLLCLVCCLLFVDWVSVLGLSACLVFLVFGV